MSGPGGVGKGTIVDELARRDHGLHLSRSWTTRQRRPHEPESAYVFVTPEAFEARIAAGGFLEWTQFLDNYYGTPTPDPPDPGDTSGGVPGDVLVLEIEVDGAQQVKRTHPEAVLIFVLPPSRLEQERRLRGRGDTEDHVAQRLRKALDEEPVGLAIADHVVINDHLATTVDEMLAIIAHHRAQPSGVGPSPG